MSMPKHILDGYRFLDFTQYLAGQSKNRCRKAIDV
jgi:hypothetical protein